MLLIVSIVFSPDRLAGGTHHLGKLNPDHQTTPWSGVAQAVILIAVRRFFYRFERIDQLWSSRRSREEPSKTSSSNVKLQPVQKLS
ncbi:hypothetical protein HFO21_13725 [Rhizobium laguerreae]|nr:hypothetical protein [Rhizobium laguerreae]